MWWKMAKKKELPEVKPVEILSAEALAARTLRIVALTDEAKRLMERLKEIEAEVQGAGGHISLIAHDNYYNGFSKPSHFRVSSSQGLRD